MALKSIKIGRAIFLAAILIISFGRISASTNKFPYKINSPKISFSLPDILKEVSGIVWLEENTLACVQDENGKIYIFNTEHKKIIDSCSFSSEGDYEGIAGTGTSLYVLRSDGILYEIGNFQSSEKVEKEYNLSIPSPNCEGICYDKINNRLLISSKGKPVDLDEKKAKFVRHIYSFNLATKTLQNEPVFEISLPEIERFIKNENICLPPKIKKNGEEKDRKVKFRTSGISVHPLTGEIYILSAVEYLLYIFNQNGNVKNVILLDIILYPKAEGITFSPSGDMYISNEGENSTPNILLINQD